mmetsp:Transcript_14676/g.28075  ORF Transcript_14676/g.28075 Transcript_14676/m.28075 type:complete len:108 (-) Transcript_14676:428-751(-)
MDEAAPPPNPIFHGGSAKGDKARAYQNVALSDVLVPNVAVAPRDHDGRAIPPHLPPCLDMLVRKYPVRLGHPNSLLNAAPPIGPSSMMSNALAIQSGLPYSRLLTSQ